MPGTRQNNPKFGECAKRGIDLYGATVLFHHYVMAHRKTKSSTFACGFGRKEGIEYLLFYFGRYSSAIVTNADFNFVTKISCRSGQSGFEAVANQLLAGLRPRRAPHRSRAQRTSSSISPT